MKNFFKALANFQNECPVILKDTQGYGYVFADLPAILEVINPLLKKHGLGFTQPLSGNQIKTIVFHVESGESIESLTDIPQGVKLSGMNDFQVLGSAITYLRRYSLSSILGIITDKDTDASGEQKQAKTEPKNDKAWLNENDENWKNISASISQGKEIKMESLKKRFNISKATQDKLKSTFNIS